MYYYYYYYYFEPDLETILAQVHDLLLVVSLHVVDDPHEAFLEDDVTSHIDRVGEDDLGLRLREVVLVVVGDGPLDCQPESEPGLAEPRRCVVAQDDDAVLAHEVGVAEEVVQLVLLILLVLYYLLILLFKLLTYVPTYIISTMLLKGALNFSSPLALLVQVDELVERHDTQRVWWLVGGEHQR